MQEEKKIAIAREYFLRADQGRMDVLDLFTQDTEFYFPKFGVGRGRDEFIELATSTGVAKMMHRLDDLRLIVEGNYAVVEGTSAGTLNDGQTWSGGETPGGRFCSIFTFDDQLRIERMFIYLDPDYGGKDTPRFVSRKAGSLRW